MTDNWDKTYFIEDFMDHILLLGEEEGISDSIDMDDLNLFAWRVAPNQFETRHKWENYPL